MGRSQSPVSVERPVRWREPVVKFNDLPERQKKIVISVTSEAYRRHVDFGKIAVAIKKSLDKTCSTGSWQVIIALLLRYGLVAVIGVATGIFVYHHYSGQQERPYERGHDRNWRTSDYREPHDPWNSGASSSTRRERSHRSRSNSTVRRRRRSNHEETYSQKEMMIDELCAGQVECSICVELIDARQEIYTCKKCYNIFHLICIRKWARTSLSSSGTHWTCPVCKAGSTHDPSLLVYSCLCGQTVKPVSRPGVTPHCCAMNCRRCHMPCHPGACD
ncbi:hypothetical protein GE061_008164 [Apolygus lucorum]|uniref:Uncharacterized protein n=1 Tax=Apolygus lucorum TaxID=248454 RepID=A0A6A4IQ67_APOLU|nr:hypothetical protein GE061_008164 [Apolygus lucorum]